MAHLIDTHCHLTYEGLIERIDEVVAQAQAVGVGEFVTIATDLADADKAFALASRHSCIHVAAGIHPHQAGNAGDGWDAALLKTVAPPNVCAVGEMGLDYHYDFSDRPAQARVFRRQIEIAAQVGKPIIIHCREAHADVMAMLRDGPRPPNVVFHCFTGTIGEAEEILAAGHWISLTGVVTFKKSAELREVARLIPADRLMIETDSPYLSPEPVRSVRPNEPAHLPHTAKCVAAARGLSEEALAALTTANARRFFRI